MVRAGRCPAIGQKPMRDMPSLQKPDAELTAASPVEEEEPEERKRA
jgi:hypothetical protein